ncbi:MAG: hypothetical protein IJ218_02000 [Alphaproteobacteria bacterium]|nr:hypothetical protein [Alphaproteobacteria bacterium]
MAQKSLFKKFMGLFWKQTSKPNGNNLSAREAINLQNAYIASGCIADTPITPPYSEILRQLESPAPEIYSAAIYYLQKIALNEPQQRNNILQGLNNYLAKKNKISPQNKELLLQAIAEIRKFVDN